MIYRKYIERIKEITSSLSACQEWGVEHRLLLTQDHGALYPVPDDCHIKYLKPYIIV